MQVLGCQGLMIRRRHKPQHFLVQYLYHRDDAQALNHIITYVSRSLSASSRNLI